MEEGRSRNSLAARSGITRRDFLGGGAAAAALTILPSDVLGGQGRVGPNDKITIASIGVGAQGTRVMMDYLKIPDVQ
ncbi:MAG TPA: twin-arginine translocation signal domain-containing protein, partial [Terriglobia bacterium]|nr:twin-arginine translocation signal domain-containing protein [Terriglobia bacterium]